MARILVLDDDPDVRQGISGFLRRLGHEVVEAADGRAVLAGEGVPYLDLVITDINMPEVDGIEVIVALKEKNPRVPVIAISGGGRVPKGSLLEDAGVLGAVSTLPKPFELAELRGAVELALGSPGGEGP